MITHDSVIRDVCQREIDNGCYDVKIDGVEIFHHVKRYLRNLELSKYGLGESVEVVFQPRTTMMKSMAISFVQLYRLRFSRKCLKNCIYSFRRVDKVNGLFVDKFTDPIIDNSSIGNSYIVLEAGRNGSHSKPRCHSNHIVYADWLNAWSFFRTRLFLPYFRIKNKCLLSQLFYTIDKAFPSIIYSHNEIVKTVLYGIQKREVYSAFFKRIRCERLIAPSRFDFQMLIPAARDNNMLVVEVQHGITYSESLTYSGYRSLMSVPDLFLTFGDMAPKSVYGIEEKKIFNIGFAFLDYIKDCVLSDVKGFEGVLLISEPSVTTAMVSVATQLARKCPGIVFSFRPHPNEYLSQEQLEMIKAYDNIEIDDNTQNILVSLKQFRHVIGENSTVLYEALHLGCIVGRLAMEGLSPKYLEESDKEYFLEIHSSDDFLRFYNTTTVKTNVKHIYMPFNRAKFEELISHR